MLQKEDSYIENSCYAEPLTCYLSATAVWWMETFVFSLRLYGVWHHDSPFALSSIKPNMTCCAFSALLLTASPTLIPVRATAAVYVVKASIASETRCCKWRKLTCASFVLAQNAIVNIFLPDPQLVQVMAVAPLGVSAEGRGRSQLQV